MESPTLEQPATGEYVIQGEPLGTVDSPGVTSIARGKPDSRNPLGRIAFDRAGFDKFQRKSLESKREYLKQQWTNIGYMVLSHATALCQSLPKKDYGRLVQLLTSAGISYDKVFPKADNTSGINVALNLFNGLPTEKVVRVIGEVPVPTTTPLPTDK